VQLVVSKCDLDEGLAGEILNQYRDADCAPLKVSARTGEGLEALRQRLAGRVCALAGQSGAGKSTLINALYGLELETGDLSRKIDRGKNTTRHCQLIPVEGGGMVLDTPGFSLLESALFDPVELKDSWPEFAPFEGHCYFQPCYHATEPRCAVLDAVAAGQIDSRRHERYRELLEEMKMRWRDRYD
jgi:ribosome biogenesis GTPase